MHTEYITKLWNEYKNGISSGKKSNKSTFSQCLSITWLHEESGCFLTKLKWDKGERDVIQGKALNSDL